MLKVLDFFLCREVDLEFPELNMDGGERLCMELGGKRSGKLVKVKPYQGELRVDIRQWIPETPTSKRYPTKAGVSLPLSRYKALEVQIPLISTALKKCLEKKDPVALKIHLGGNIFVTVNTPFTCVNLRLWYLNEAGDLRPSYRGIALRSQEWQQFCDISGVIYDFVPELVDITTCSESHNTRMQGLRCRECNPNDYERHVFDEMFNDAE